MDSYLKLTAAEAVAYNRELDAIEPQEREVVMQWTNEWIEKGKVEGRRELISRLLSRRLGQLPDNVNQRIAELADHQIDELAEALLDFKDLEDAQLWLAQHA
jgi:hypothetical protein